MDVKRDRAPQDSEVAFGSQALLQAAHALGDVDLAGKAWLEGWRVQATLPETKPQDRKGLTCIHAVYSCLYLSFQTELLIRDSGLQRITPNVPPRPILFDALKCIRPDRAPQVVQTFSWQSQLEQILDASGTR